MAIIRYTRDPTKPYVMSPEELARLDALTDEEITAAAESDPDNPPLTEAEFRQIRAIQTARRARERTRLSQDEFASAYGIEATRLRELEQGDAMPDPVLVAYLALIADDPERARRVVERVDGR